MPHSADIWSLTDLCTPWCVHVVVTLRVPQHLSAGARDIRALAAAASCDADALARVIRHLISKCLFAEPAPNRFELNDAARVLLDEGTQLGLNLDGFGGRMAYPWSTLLDAVRTGKPAYHKIFGKPFWDDLAAHPKIAAEFDALIGPAGHGTPDANVLIDNDWQNVRSVVDIGGGTGSLLAEILKAHPSIRGTLVELPSTIARSTEIFRASGVADRVTLAGQSFFEPLPAGADLYLFKNALADWPDEEAQKILARCAEALQKSPPAARAVILGGVSPDETVASPELLMLVLLGGKGRSLTEFRTLAGQAGLKVHKAGRLPSGKFAVECTL